MRTKMTIVGVVLGCLAAAAAVFAAATLWLGWAGLAACTAAAALICALYLRFGRPWHSRWGATDEEVRREMPGDRIIPNAHSTTRAVTVACAPERLWPWVVQLGYGRGGWYSYDWIDNDGNRSAERIIPELQNLKVGDAIEMLPGFGPKVREIVRNRYFLAGDAEAGTWCLALYPEGSGTRLVSRWRQDWKARGLAARFFVALADPGAFVMEQKMLRTLRARAEAEASRSGQAGEVAYRSSSKEVA